MDWSEGVTLPELLDWINGVAARFRPDDVGADSRAGEEFTPRTFRHYQTLGCIDAPDRVGKRAVYRFRQYVQALLLRRLIWERLPSERIATIMSLVGLTLLGWAVVWVLLDAKKRGKGTYDYMKRVLPIVLLMLGFVACGKDSGSGGYTSPTGPSTETQTRAIR